LSVKLNALTVDVEDYFHVAAFSTNIAPDDWEQMESRIEKNMHSLIDLFDRFGAKATFFVLGWVAERYPDIIRRIDASGHEVASHGYSHQMVYNQPPEVFREETYRSKALLESLIQKPVTGYRAASYSITEKSLWALDILIDLGFKWDSSIFPVKHDLYGIPGAPVFPYELRSPHRRKIIEFPLSTVRLAGQAVPVAGGGYFRLFPYWLTRWALRSINDNKQPFIFYLHPWEIDPDQPKVDASWFSRFRHYNNLHKSWPRLEMLLGDFPFSTVSTVLEQEGLLSAGV
jgi:polysaccharide deacetylase family protein (PEP-CTERM system associated)